MKQAELEEPLVEAKVAIDILWSTLEAIHGAMENPDNNPEIYKEAILGAANAAHGIKAKLEEALCPLMREDGRD